MKRREGMVLANTRTRQLHLNFSKGEVTIQIDNQRLGIFNLTSGEIFDESHHLLSHCRRDHDTQISIEGIELGRRHRTYPLALETRQAAVLVTATDTGLLSKPAPLCAQVSPQLTRLEADWLLVMCIRRSVRV